MNLNFNDIGDDEIRIVSSHSPLPVKLSDKPPAKKNRMKNIGIILFIIVFIIGLLCLFVFLPKSNENNNDSEQFEVTRVLLRNARTYKAYYAAPSAYDNDIGDETDIGTNIQTYTQVPVEPCAEMTDTVVNSQPLSIFTPVGAVPVLSLGTATLNDTSAVLVVEAASVRKDTGGILGAFVKGGELLSRGQSQAGFCAIVNGKMTLGVAESTPYLEQAIETGGYFFRQYPLVVGRMAIESKLQNSSYRKALAELNDRIVVVVSRKKMTMNEFSETLVKLGVSTAIYLTGSKAYGFARLKDGSLVEFGNKRRRASKNTSYIVWKPIE